MPSGSRLVCVSGVKGFDRFVAGPNEDAGVAAGLLVHPLHDQLEIGDRLLHSHDAGGRAGALDFAVFERPGVRCRS